MEFSQYTHKEIKEVLGLLKTREGGLSEHEVVERQKVWGPNEIKVKEISLFEIFFRQFQTPFSYLLFVAAIIAFLIGEEFDGLVILTFVVLNVIFGFSQEAKAVKTAAILRKYIPLKARVLRENQERTIEQKFLVPGDIVLLEAGNIVPADLRIIKTENFLVDEEVLSGESVPVTKISQPLLKEAKEIFEAQNILFAGTSLVSGEAEGVVIGTGKKTVFGEIARLTTEILRESVYEKNLLKFSRFILRIVVSSIVIVFLASLIIKGTADFFDFLIFCIALVVSIIPEALPVVVTFSFSQGALKLAKKKVVVKRLSAIEDLGDIEILCTDKTGTLTENKLRLEKISSPDPERCSLYALLCSSYIKEEIESAPNPFDSAILEGVSFGIREALKNFREIAEIPFESSRLRNSALLQDKKGNLVLIVKGAPETILKLSSRCDGNLEREKALKDIEQAGREGKRILALAFKEFNRLDYSEEDEKDLTFLGYFSFSDPLKKTAKSAIELSKKLAVQIKILTGDSPDVAGAVGKATGLIKNGDEVILGEALESLNEEELERVCEKYNVFARVSPEAKLKIVRALQKKHEVGFLGEGINDAPALKIANVAIAVKEGADISREVSDIILIKKDLRVIVDAIGEGRNIFSNINKYIKCTLASNFGNFYSIAAISLFIPFLPMLPVQILLVNLLSDFPLIAVATDSVDVEELKKPKFYQLHQIISLIIVLGLVSTVFDFIFFGIFHKADPGLLRTLWFIESILTEIALIFSIRTRRFFLGTKFPSLPLIVLSILSAATTILLPFTAWGRGFFHFVIPPLTALLTVISLIICYFFASELAKFIYYRQRGRNGSSLTF